ncbi:helix-turn-helix domain-containing protein [Oscillatoria sp. FACHB-1406]|nr:helix-turn-helix domain-containing protein [Oscillatoria sp. FACHB-1406]MBD2577829.1 helix-turn-helix domain-containing protein [Oscillatoria sp. FACHB-1406]
MQERGISSFRQFCQQSGLSARQLLRLRRGELLQMRIEDALKVSSTLQIPLQGLIEQFTATPAAGSVAEFKAGSEEEGKKTEDFKALQQEYLQLQQHLQDQRELLMQEFQRSSLQAIESWLVSWSAAATKAKENPDLPATRLLPLVKPLEQLLQQWQVEAIATVGEELQYDPQLHQPVEGTAQPGERVRVRYAGYRHRGQLLFRAKVSPVS